MKLKVGVVQMDCVLKDKAYNLKKAAEYIDKVGDKVDILCFPEFFSTGYNLGLINKEFFSLAETIPGPTTEQLSEKAQQFKTAIIGNIVEKDEVKEGVLYDTTFFINEHGEYVGKYRKAHLYPTEHQYFCNGSEFPVFEICGVKVGSAICYDHAFGEMFRIMALKGAEVVFMPSAIPKNFEYLVDLRTQARASDNQIFTVAVNRAGIEGEVTYCGYSQIVDPRGSVICKAGDEEEILIGSIDLSLIIKERLQEPVFRSRRAELYKDLTL
jgi:predicted amidohydrolase